MAKTKIPAEIKQQADAIVVRFNTDVLHNDPEARYVTRYRDGYLYLGHEFQGRFGPICRLTYTGDIDDWDFAIYKYSSGRYDPGEWLFPGGAEVDGTIAGAMHAGLKAYPP